MIRKYKDIDFKEVNSITINKWKDENIAREEMNDFLHTLLTKYCFMNPSLSFINYSNKIDAFVFAGYKKDKPNCYDWLVENTSKMSENERKEALNYYKYLDKNHELVLNHMKEKDIYVSLLASNKPGCGKELLLELEKIAKKDKAHIFLWTDETCSFEYYQKNNFIMVEEYDISFQNQKIKTYIYKK